MYISDEVRSTAVNTFSIVEGDTIYIVSSDGVISAVVEGVIKTFGRFGFLDYAIVVDESATSVLGTKIISYRDYCMSVYKSKIEAESVLNALNSKEDDTFKISKLVIISDKAEVIKLRVADVSLDGFNIVYTCTGLNGVHYRVNASEVNNFASRRLVASNKDEALKMLDLVKSNADVHINKISRYVLLSDVLSIISRYEPRLRDPIKADLENLIGLNVNSIGIARLLAYDEGFLTDTNELLNVSGMDIDISKISDDPALLDRVVSLSFEDTMGFEHIGDYQFGEVCKVLEEKYGSDKDTSSSDDDDFDIVIEDEEDGSDMLTSYSNSYKYEGN